jgi:hypothetical protein
MTLFARLFAWLRRKPQQPVYDEREAYERSYGERSTEIVVTPKPPPRPRVLPKLAGDYLRRCFEERLEGRHRVEPASVDEGPQELLRREAVLAAERSRSQELDSALQD